MPIAPFSHTHTCLCLEAVVWRTWQFFCVLAWLGLASKKSTHPRFTILGASLALPAFTPAPRAIHRQCLSTPYSWAYLFARAGGDDHGAKGSTARTTANGSSMRAGRAWVTGGHAHVLARRAHLHTRITTHNDIYTHIRRRLQGCCEAEDRRTRAGSHDEGVVHAGLLISASDHIGLISAGK